MSIRLHALMLVAIVFGATVGGLWAQAETAAPKAFEVISIKPVDRRMAQGSYWQPSANGNLSIHAVPLVALVMGAYNLQEFQIKGLPQWAREEEYDVQATTGLSGESQSRAEFERDNQARLKALLRDRCGLRAHFESVTASVYGIAVSKEAGARQLKESSAGDGFGFTVTPRRVISKSISLDELALQLSSLVHEPIVNRTGLGGKYQIDLDWSGDQRSDPEADLANLARALRETGLHLRRQKEAMPSLVIDEIRRPSTN